MKSWSHRMALPGLALAVLAPALLAQDPVRMLRRFSGSPTAVHLDAATGVITRIWRLPGGLRNVGVWCAADATELLTAAPSVRLLVTSQAPLRIRAEREYAVAPLPLLPPGLPGDCPSSPPHAGRAHVSPSSMTHD